MSQNLNDLTPEQIKDLCLNAIADVKGNKPMALDVSHQTDVMDWIIIASGTSSRHVRAVAENVISAAREADLSVLGVEGGAGSDWCLVDLGSAVVNIMLPETRASYDLERLWSDGKIVAPGVHEL